MHVGGIATAVDLLSLLGQRRLLGDVVAGAVELGETLGDDGALGVPPGAGADAVARVDGAGALRAEVCVPGLAARSRCLREHLTVLVRAGEAAEVPTFSGTCAGREERGLTLLGVRDRGVAEPQQHQRPEDRTARSVHLHPPLGWRWCRNRGSQPAAGPLGSRGHDRSTVGLTRRTPAATLAASPRPTGLREGALELGP